MSNFSLNVKINGVEQAVSSIGQVEEALNATRNELKNVEIGSQAFEELGKQARALQGTLENSFERFTNFNANLDNFTQAAGRLGSTVASGFTIALSAVQLFGDESEELTEAQIKAQQALAVAFAATTIATNSAKLVSDAKLVVDKIQLGITRLLTIATGQQAVATEGATIAQTALNLVMKANPITLVVTAITALVSGLLIFNSVMGDSEEQTKNYTESIEKNTQTIEDNEEALNRRTSLLREQQKVNIEILKLEGKITESEAKTAEERLKIREENSEKIFEKQKEFLEKEISERENGFNKKVEKLSLDLYGVLLSDLEGANEKIVEGNSKTIKAVEKLFADAQSLARENRKIEGDEEEKEQREAIAKNLETQAKIVKDRTDALRGLRNELKVLNKQRESDEAESLRVQNEENAKKLEERKKKWKEAYDKIKEFVKTTFKDLTDIEQDYFERLEDLTAKNGLEQVKLEQKRADEQLKIIEKTFNEEITKSNLSAKEKEKAQNDFNDFYKRAQDAQLNFFTERINREQKILDEQAAEIKFIYATLQEEITVGDQNVYNRREALIIRQKELAIEQNRFEVEQNRFKVVDLLKNLSLELKLRQDNLKRLEQLEENRAEAERKQQLENTKQLYKDKFGEEFFQTEEGKKILNQLEINLEEELQIKLQEIREKYGREEVETERAITAEKIAIVQEFVDFSLSTANIVLGLFQSISDLAAVNRENALIDLRTDNAERLNAINEQYNAELEAQQQALAQGLINQEQYNSAILALDTTRTQAQAGLENKLRKEELAAKKKAFEDEKKLRIASTIISGIQGALQAFTGAFQLGPIAGPIVGGILAALVAATTGIQVAAISKQKFDSSGSVNITPPNPSGAGPIGGGGAANLGAATSTGGFTQFDQSLTGSPTGGSSGSGQNGADPVKVYVLESDITATQNRVRTAEGNGTIG